MAQQTGDNFKIFQYLFFTVVGVGGFFLIKSLFKSKEQVDKEAGLKQVDAELAKETAKTGLSYPLSQYTTYADALYGAMKGLGTDEAAIYAVFNQLMNNADVLQVVKSFGIRGGETLVEWLYGDLSAGEIQKVNSILSSKNITVRF